MSRHAPIQLANAVGLRLELNRDGGVRRIQLGDVVVNLFLGNGMEPGPANVWLRSRGGAGADAVPLLGPSSPLRPSAGRARTPGGGFRSAGEWRGVAIALRLVLAEQQGAWCWQVKLENRSAEERTVDLVHAQDLGLASFGAVRLNEYYVSHYVDFSPMEHARCGWVVAARQNLAQGGRHPWAVVGSVRRGTSFATDGLQLFGLAQRSGELPSGIREGLPARRLQHEHAMPAIQDEPVTLAPGARWTGGFFVALEADHPAATSATDLAAVDATLSWAASLSTPATSRPKPKPVPGAGGAAPGVEGGEPAPPDATLFAAAPLLASRDVDDAALRRLFPPPWRHEERDGPALLSFFHGDGAHVVLRAKEARTQRPHGHILRTGQARVPEEASLTSTVWMSGVFHSMVTQGHVSINRFLSTTHGWLGLFRSHGLRIFVQVNGRWELLGIPSAFEMRPRSCRWIYRYDGGALEVASATREGAHALTLRARVLEGRPVAWLATLHVALGGDDGNARLPMAWRRDGEDAVVAVPEGSDLHARFPDGAFVLSPVADGAVLVRDDGRLFTDGKSRGLPFLSVEAAACSAFGLEVVGRLVPDVHVAASPSSLPRLTAPGEGPAAAEVRRLDEMLPWWSSDAQVHHLAPRGLEQYSGGGWGTRDVCQGPLEMSIALDRGDAAKDLLLRVFAAQNEDGDWPQWFQFLDRERDLRAPDSHGDVVFWPLLGAARYVLGTGDPSLFTAEVPFYAPSSTGASPSPILAHVDRALGVVRRRRVPGTALAAYGHGDWNDSLQPADPALREQLCSTWTVVLHHQTLVALARALRFAGHAARATALEAEAGDVRRDLRRHLAPGGILAGYVVFSGGDATGPLFHPHDRQTGVRYSLLPMMHAVLEDLCTPDEAAAHLALMREHLWAPDGARLFDRPLPYHGGIERLFQRAETSAFFGREIGLMYMHAHLRYAQMQAHVGDARGLLESLALSHPVQLRERLPQATLRQANCYFSSSDAAFHDRYEAQESYSRIAAGTVALDGGWRVYSSGPGIALALVVGALLGVRRDGDRLVVDPVIAPELTGLRAEVPVLGRHVQVEYHVERHGRAPRAVILNGRGLTFERVENPYRPGGAAIPLREFTAHLREDGRDAMRVELE